MSLGFRVAVALAALSLQTDRLRADETDLATAGRAVEAGLTLVQRAAANYPEHRDCFSCHHQTLPMLAMSAARDHRFKTDGDLLQSQADFTLQSFRDRLPAIRNGEGVGGGAMTVGYALWALQIAGRGRDTTTDALAEFLLKTQRPDGHWTTGHRPPLEESAVTCTALAAVDLKRFAPDSRRADAAAAVDRARDWLVKAPPKVQEDRAFKLAGLVWLGAKAGDVAATREGVLAAQRDDGSWASRDDLPGDAYATGQSLAWLRLAGLGGDHPAVRRGLRYLLRTRRDDGSWKVETRSKPVQVYFDNGDPHGKHQFISTPATCWAVVALAGVSNAGGPAVTPRSEEPYDLVIRSGRVVDGTGNPWFHAEVAVRGDRIVAVGRLPEGTTARRLIDARGLVVAPGFIDVHSHSDTTLLEDGAALSKVYQGVTTEVLGEDTSGGPAKGRHEPGTFRKGDRTLRWETLGGYFDALERSGTAVNVASYVGLGTLLRCVLGDDLGRPDAGQLARVEALLDEALGEGACGLSAMLAAPRELNVTTDDLVSLARVVARHRAIVSFHIRNEGTGVLDAVREAIAVGERGGVPIDVIHLKIADRSLWGRMGEVVALIDDARRRGVDVQANVYPYTRGNNDLVSIVPPWAHEGGTAALLARLKDLGQRARIKTDIRGGIPGWYNHYTAVGGDWSRMLVSGRLTAANARFQGKTMDTVLAEKSKGQSGTGVDPLDLMLDFLAEEGGSVSTIYAHHDEADMNLALTRPWCSIGSDGLALAVDGPLRRGHPHPRSFGTFPRVLGIYVRERAMLTLEDAVRKMTSLNAAKIGLRDRGLVRPGQFADLTVFDPTRIADRATYLEPFRYAEGVRYVVVNGRLVLDAGKPTDARSGRCLRHGKG
jgi:N-acyl-D-amino-acid deacylase